MTTIDHVRPVTASTSRRLFIVLLPLTIAMGLAAVGAFGTYVAMRLPVRLLHFLAISLAIGTLAFALSTLLRRYTFAGVLPFWATLAVALAVAPVGGLIAQQVLAVS